MSRLALIVAAITFVAATDDEIRRILVERIDVRKQGVGIVVGMIEPAGTRVVSYGKLDANDSRTLDGNTVFEIGSVTKVFTSLLPGRHGAARRGGARRSDIEVPAGHGESSAA